MNPQIVLTKDLELFEDQMKRLEAFGDVTYHNNEPTSDEDWFSRCINANIICSGIFGLNSEKVYELQNVFISLPFVGAEFLDKARLEKRNIAVSNSPGCNKEAVVEWIIGMLLMNFRNLSNLNRSTTISKKEALRTGLSLATKTITILGAGHIGTHLKNVCATFGMNVVVFKRNDDILESVKHADIVVNCLSVTESSKNLLNKKFFLSLKKGSFFVSASRHQTYDIQGLKEALDNHILIGAVDDAANATIGDTNDPVYRQLIDHPNISVTPHIAWNTESERRKSNDMMIDNIEAWLKKEPIHLI